MQKKILIIDDCLPMLDCLRMVLELHHYQVEIAQDGICLLNNQITPDLMLIDYHIPGIDGYSIFEQVKNSPKLKHVPIILMSGHKDVAQISILFGANDFIAKPFDFDVLLNKITKLVETEKPFKLN